MNHLKPKNFALLLKRVKGQLKFWLKYLSSSAYGGAYSAKLGTCSMFFMKFITKIDPCKICSARR